MFVVRRAEPVPCSVTVPYFFYSQLTDPRLYDQQVHMNMNMNMNMVSAFELIVWLDTNNHRSEQDC